MFGDHKQAERDPIVDRLNLAIDRLQKDVTRVEIWAGALSAYAQPVAEYEVDARYRLPRAAAGPTLPLAQKVDPAAK